MRNSGVFRIILKDFSYWYSISTTTTHAAENNRQILKETKKQEKKINKILSFINKMTIHVIRDRNLIYIYMYVDTSCFL